MVLLVDYDQTIYKFRGAGRVSAGSRVPSGFPAGGRDVEILVYISFTFFVNEKGREKPQGARAGGPMYMYI